MASSRIPGCGLLIARLAGIVRSGRPIRRRCPGTIGPIGPVAISIPRPEYVGKARATPFTGSEVKNDVTIGRVRAAARLAAQALAEVGRAVAPGVTTDELDRV